MRQVYMIEIDDRFKRKEFRFCPLRKHSKESFSDHNKVNYPYDSPTLNSHFKDGCNYGILVGYGFDLLIDIDNNKIFERLKPLLPETLTQISAIKKCQHLFYKLKFSVSSRMFTGYVDLLAKGKYVVGSNSTVLNEKNPNDKNIYTYKLDNDLPIATLSKENYDEILRIVEGIYNLNKPIKIKTPKKTNPDINWFSTQDAKRYFNNPILITEIKKIYKRDKQWIFEAYFTDVEKRMSFGLNNPTEAKMFDILINGKTSANFYTIINNGKYMRQVDEV